MLNLKVTDDNGIRWNVNYYFEHRPLLEESYCLSGKYLRYETRCYLSVEKEQDTKHIPLTFLTAGDPELERKVLNLLQDVLNEREIPYSYIHDITKKVVDHISNAMENQESVKKPVVFDRFSIAINSSDDPWVRKVGMIKSFSRALRREVEDRSLRKLIFREFWRVHGRRIYKNKVARMVV
ncbi:MAG: hypothetical protein N3A54_00585 [Patescibacteria group bacterium]|nr:hypothetical protein [Patescibacteria group bacterium]